MNAATRTLLREYRAAKALSSKQKVAGRAIVELPTMEDVADFARHIRRSAGVQDVTMIEEQWFLFYRWEAGQWVTDGQKFGRDTVLECAATTVANGGKVTVSFPGVFTNGTQVTFHDEGLPHDSIARTTDYGPTETYLSM